MGTTKKGCADCRWARPTQAKGAFICANEFSIYYRMYVYDCIRCPNYEGVIDDRKSEMCAVR